MEQIVLVIPLLVVAHVNLVQQVAVYFMIIVNAEIHVLVQRKQVHFQYPAVLVEEGFYPQFEYRKFAILEHHVILENFQFLLYIKLQIHM